MIYDLHERRKKREKNQINNCGSLWKHELHLKRRKNIDNTYATEHLRISLLLSWQETKQTFK